ncbi:acyl carrier protein [Streptomyces sp. NPDC005805]|uniref:acyl carrier protein n=1 Tax=Streptomyces sp. NPDC005805 TaxID=3157068 RepID=UPI0033C95799
MASTQSTGPRTEGTHEQGPSAPGHGGAAAAGSTAPAGGAPVLPAAPRASAALRQAQHAVAEVLGWPDASRVAPERTLTELGVDSLGMFRLLQTVAARTGAHIPETELFDVVSVADLADLIAPELEPRDPGGGRAQWGR